MKRGIKATIASASALTLATLVPIGTAMAQEGDAVITNTETVNVSLDPSGNVDVARVYDQIAVQGSGTVDYANPVSTVGLRNLDSFGGFTVEGDSIVEETDVDGQLRRRAVSDFDLELPVTVSVMYRLDGQEVSPADLVGKSGEVDVTYTIENMTGSEEQISITDGQGNEVTKTAMIYDPFAGSMSFTLPPNYTDVVSDSGFLPAGDGRGGTLMNLSVTLVPGLTDQVLEANFTAQVEDAVIPPVSLSFLPLVVRENTSTRPQLEALQGGAETGQELASNAVLLDENVLALADGAADLVSGILLLNDGAAELSDGLVNTAAPGSAELAAGADELAAGLNDTAVPGSQQLAAGAGELAAGLTGRRSRARRRWLQVPATVAAGLTGQRCRSGQLSAARSTSLPQVDPGSSWRRTRITRPLLAALRASHRRHRHQARRSRSRTRALLNEAIRPSSSGCRTPPGDRTTPGPTPQPCGLKQVVGLGCRPARVCVSHRAGDLDQLSRRHATGSLPQAVSVQPPTTGVSTAPAAACW